MWECYKMINRYCLMFPGGWFFVAIACFWGYICFNPWIQPFSNWYRAAQVWVLSSLQSLPAINRLSQIAVISTDSLSEQMFSLCKGDGTRRTVVYCRVYSSIGKTNIWAVVYRWRIPRDYHTLDAHFPHDSGFMDITICLWVHLPALQPARVRDNSILISLTWLQPVSIPLRYKYFWVSFACF